MAEARVTKRRILLEVGGDWSMWCHIMDNVFENHPDLRDFRAHNYVTVKVYYGRDNPNQSFLGKYPAILYYPHFFVLDSNGRFFHSQTTHRFESGGNYNAKKVEAFLRKWAPGSPKGMTPDPPPVTPARKYGR